jgi:hypothetical protein
MKKSLDVFSQFPNDVNDEYVNYTTAQTYLFLVGFVRATDCKLSNENISQASHYTDLFSPLVRHGSGMDAQITLAKTAVAVLVDITVKRRLWAIILDYDVR